MLEKFLLHFIFALVIFVAALGCPEARGAVCDFGAAFGFPQNWGNIATPKITEASGLLFSRRNPGVLWTHNDGVKNQLYAVSTNGALMATFNLTVPVTDWEDLGAGPGPVAGENYLYLGDIGSNSADRDSVRILRVPEPLVDPAWVANPVTKKLEVPEVFTLKYPFGTYNAEALLVDPIKLELYIATKETSTSRLFKISLANLQVAQAQTLELVSQMPFPKASGGAVSADGRYLALRRENYAALWHRSLTETFAEALAREGTAIPLAGLSLEPNGEALAFSLDETGYVTLSEGLNQPLHFFQAEGPEPHIRFEPPSVVFDGRIILTIVGCPGRTARLESSTDFNAWNPAGAIELDENGRGQFDTATVGEEKFFRALL